MQGLGLQTSLDKVKDKIAEEIGTVRGEVADLRVSVKGVWSAMEAGKEDVTEKIMTVGWEVDKLGQGMKEVKKRTRAIKKGNGKKHDGDRKVKRRPAGNKGGVRGRKRGM